MRRHSDCSCSTHRTYFLSCEEYEELWDFAGGLCQICKTPPEETPRGKLCIDHLGPYGYGMVRGLLCDRCNSHMRQVDDGTFRRPSMAVKRYQQQAWCSRHVMFGRGFSVDRTRFLPRWKWPVAPEGETA